MRPGTNGQGRSAIVYRPARVVVTLALGERTERELGGLEKWTVAISLLVAAIAAAPAAGREPEPGRAIDRWFASAYAHTERGEYTQAEADLDRAAALLGAHPDTLREGRLGNLRGVLALRRGRFEAARVHLEAAIPRIEEAAGPDHLELAAAEQHLADALQPLGLSEAALRHATRSIAIREARLPPGDLQLGFAYSSRGLILLYGFQDFEAATRDLEASLAIARQHFAADDAILVTPLSNLAKAHLGRRAPGDIEKAEALLREALRVQDAAGVPALHHTRFFVASGLAHFYEIAGRNREAVGVWEELLEQARLAYGAESPASAFYAARVGAAYLELGRYEEAEVLLRQALAAQQKMVASGHPDAIETLRFLAVWREDRGDIGGALELRREIVALQSASRDPASPGAVGDTVALAWLLVELGRVREGRRLIEGAIRSLEARLGKQDPRLANAHDVLGVAYAKLGLTERAEGQFERSLELHRRAGGPDAVQQAVPLNNLADLWAREGRLLEAEAASREVIRLVSAWLGPETPRAGLAYANLAHVYERAGRVDEAHRALDEALRRYESAGETALSKGWLAHLIRARLRLRRGEREAALAAIERASSLVGRQIAGARGHQLADLTSAARDRREVFDLHLALLDGLDTDDPRRVHDSFLVIQRARLQRTARAFAATQARFASGDDALAVTERRHQDLGRRLADLDGQLLSAHAKGEATDVAEEEAVSGDSLAALAAERRVVAATLAELEAEIAAAHPAYAALVRPRPRTLQDVQADLARDEALLVFGVLPDRTLAWVVRPESAVLVSLPIDVETLRREIARVRTGLTWDREQVRPERAFDLVAAHRLYQRLLRPLLPAIAATRRLVIVPDGPLEGLPLALLVELPAPTGTTHPYRESRWLVDRLALRMAPAVHTLARQQPPREDTGARIALMGFGDPALPDAQARARHLDSPTDGETYGEPVPATRAQLSEMLELAGGRADHLYVGPEATEARLKTLSRDGALGRVDTLVLATHALREPGAGDPYLVLSPPRPEERDARDDGRLTAAEVARDLRLDARLVVLSACDSAAAEKRGGEVFSGLARAFFHAGARSLLVSHWPVEATATKQLMREFSRRAFREDAPNAEALRSSQLEMIGREAWDRWMVRLGVRSDRSHPIYWAPFVVVGGASPPAPGR